MNLSSSSTIAMFRILKLSSCNHIHSSFSALSFSDCCNLFFFHLKLMIRLNRKSLGILWFIQLFLWLKWIIYRCSSSYNQKNKQEINKYDVLYDTSPQYVFIKSSKTNTNCGLDNDRKDNVTTQILRITFCRKLHSLELIKNQAYTCISLTLQSTLLLNSPKRFFSDMMTFL